MTSSFSPIEKMLFELAKRHSNYPMQEVLLTRLHMHVQTKLLENRNKMLKDRQLNDTLFNALLTIDGSEDQTIQPSELSLALGSSRTNATRVADELQRRGWVERRESESDRRCLHLHLTDSGNQFLCEILPLQHKNLLNVWGILSHREKMQLEAIFRKLLVKLDTIEGA